MTETSFIENEDRKSLRKAVSKSSVFPNAAATTSAFCFSKSWSLRDAAVWQRRRVTSARGFLRRSAGAGATRMPGKVTATLRT